jgi:hypothetical protein
MRLITLLERVCFDVQCSKLDKGIIAKLLLGFGKEKRRNIREHIFRAVCRQPGKHIRRHAAYPCAYFKYPHWSSFGQTTQSVTNSLLG